MTTDILNMTRPVTGSESAEWILIVDDHPLFCDALELTMRSVMPNSEIKTAAALSSALELISVHGKPDLLALDLNLPDVSGVDGIIQARRALGTAPIIVMSSLTDPRVVSAVIAAGANGFVPKHSARRVFEDAIQTINAGGSYVPPDVETADAENDETTDAIERLSLLTAQQARILDLICEGKLNKQIAFDLSIAETTVKAHITAIMRKLGVQSRTQAVLVAQNARFSVILPDSET